VVLALMKAINGRMKVYDCGGLRAGMVRKE
jgi:hypothetical protein